MGLWRVGLAPSQMTFRNEQGETARVEAPKRPWVLVLSYWLLFFALLPALLWLLAHLLKRIPPPPKMVPVSPPIKVPPVPANLPVLPTPPQPLRPPVPTLFVGLGDLGCEVLQAVRHELREVHAGEPGQPYQFVGLNLNRRLSEQPSPYASWPGQDISLLLPPDEVSRGAELPALPGKRPRPSQVVPGGSISGRHPTVVGAFLGARPVIARWRAWRFSSGFPIPRKGFGRKWPSFASGWPKRNLQTAAARW